MRVKQLLGTLCASLALPLAVSADVSALPLTGESVEHFLLNAESHVQKTVDYLAFLPDDQKTAENLMRPWSRLANEILVNFSALFFLSQSEFPSKEAAGIAIQDFQAFLSRTLVYNTNLYRSFMGYVKQSVMGDPYDNYQIQCLLESCKSIKESLPLEDQYTLDSLTALNAESEKTPFLYLKGEAPEKIASREGLFVVTLNTCFVPGDFPFLFGGVYLHWQERVAPIADALRKMDADVVCLQEVHAEDASYALYEALKNDYAYFYAAIGPRCLGFSLNTLGCPSGLFVASKYRIEKPQFTLFSVSGFPMNFGFFDFIVKNGKTPIGHIYTTHMQALNYEQFDQIRVSQLTQILEKMHRDRELENQETPFFLCGDLNIPYGSNEPGVALICKHFEDDYNKDQGLVTAENRTCTDYFTNCFFSPPELADPNFQILDYALLLPSHKFKIHTTQIPMNDLKDLKGALSDHHALLTIIKAQNMQLHFVDCDDPILDAPSRQLSAEEIREQDMQLFFDAMLKLAKGEQSDYQKHVLVGLAAPQIGKNIQVILVDAKADGKGSVAELRLYINPEILEFSQETEEWYEGCYSTGNVKGVVTRPSKIKVRALDREGHVIQETHSGYVARIFQHEIDHLNGIRFPERVSSGLLHIVKAEEMPAYRNEQGWRNWKVTIPQNEWKNHTE